MLACRTSQPFENSMSSRLRIDQIKFHGKYLFCFYTAICYIGSFLICYFGFLLFAIFKSGRKLQIILQFFSLPAHFSFVDKRASETRSPRPLVNESILRHSFLSEFQPGSPTLYPPCTFRLKLTQASTHIVRAKESEDYFSQSFRNVS